MRFRVRIAGDEVATLAIKEPRTGIAQAEFEYEIPLADAERKLSTPCQDDHLERESVSSSKRPGETWQVDVYSGVLQGVVIAEVELKDEGQELIPPRWIGKEVTSDPDFRKINMRARALNARREGR